MQVPRNDSPRAESVLCNKKKESNFMYQQMWGEASRAGEEGIWFRWKSRSLYVFSEGEESMHRKKAGTEAQNIPKKDWDIWAWHQAV